MAHRRNFLAKATEWWKHLRPYNKRVFWKRERRAGQKEIRKEMRCLRAS